MTRLTVSKYASVPAMSSVTLDHVVPDGETWDVMQFRGAAAYSSDVEVAVLWKAGTADEEVIAVTHGDAEYPAEHRLIGDGQLILRVVLDNATSLEHTIGAAVDLIKLEIDL